MNAAHGIRRTWKWGLAAILQLAVLLFAIALLKSDPATATGSNSITSPDTVGNIGKFTSLTLDAGEHPVVSYYDDTNDDLKVIHCNDANCAGGDESITSPDTGGDVGQFTWLVLDGSGYPVVSYYDVTNGDLKLMHCNDADCAGGDENITSPDTAGDVGQFSSLVLDASGYPVISFYDATNDQLKVMHCNDANCAGGNESITTPDPGGNGGDFTSLELDTNGFPVVSYLDGADLTVLHCNDANCSGGDESVEVPDSVLFATDDTRPSLVLDASGYPVISYYGHSGSDLMVMHCNDANCVGGDESISSADTTNFTGFWTSIVLDDSGYPVVSYNQGSTGDLKVLHCNDPDCSGGDDSIALPDTAGNVGKYTSLALDGAGYPVVSYYDTTQGNLNVLHCGDPACVGAKPPTPTATATPGVTPTPTKQPSGDSDGDGCTDQQENGADPALGGQRDYLGFWDFYDVPTGSSLTRDGNVASLDIFQVLGRFNAADLGPGDFDRASDPLSTPNVLVPGADRDNYHPAYDHAGGSPTGAFNTTPPDGSIAAPDIFAVLAQFGHSCA